MTRSEAPEGAPLTDLARVYQFAVTSDDGRRAFVAREETSELAARARSIAVLLEHFGEIDDHGEGLLRTEILRSVRDLERRAVAVLA